ncbi:uncharacterized protein LOC123504882 [Portunus trituberculatus]|uniref:uncharacterized protein LOC123504882 n=1 Tax=Portunus trituberculatus TaxID=210409 RepID=UPI001E1CD5B2|nr:uncharacterized protein LOC123504882 [Portunus trituberculatus]
MRPRQHPDGRELPGLSKDWPFSCCPGFTLYLFRSTVSASVSCVVNTRRQRTPWTLQGLAFPLLPWLHPLPVSWSVSASASCVGEAVARFALQVSNGKEERRNVNVTVNGKTKPRNGSVRNEKREFELAKLASELGASPDAGVRGRKLPAYQGEDIPTYLTRFERIATLLTIDELSRIAAYLTRFERIATLLTIDEECLAVRLGSLLTGKAAELYPPLPSDPSLLQRAL